MVRAANTGISGFVDPYGRVLQQTNLFVPAKIAGTVKWINEKTFYTKHGDVLVYFSFCVTIVAVLLCIRKRTPQRVVQV
jgi:apolipoprotein N-acyltransferase